MRSRFGTIQQLKKHHSRKHSKRKRCAHDSFESGNCKKRVEEGDDEWSNALIFAENNSFSDTDDKDGSFSDTDNKDESYNQLYATDTPEKSNNTLCFNFERNESCYLIFSF